MNRMFAPWLAAMAFTLPAHAQSVPEAISDWEGVRIGLNVEAFLDNSLSFEDIPDLTGEIEDTHFGAFIGYRYQFEDIVVGVELGGSGGETTTTLSAPGFEDPIGSRTQLVRLGVEAGYAFGRILPYGTAGFASLTFLDTAEGDNRGFGYFYGAGVEYQTGEYTSVALEVLRHEFDDFSELEFMSVEATTVTLGFALRY